MQDFQPKILVVDDEPLMLEVLKEGLLQANCLPRCVESGAAAMDLINREKFDAVFLDWLMPGMDGLELARQIAQSERNCYCPIVMITSSTEPGSMKNAFNAGINFFLQKPVSFEMIQRLVSDAYDLMLKERLRYHRFTVELPVVCRWQSGSITAGSKGVSSNLNSYGMCLTLDPVPPPELLVSLSFTLPAETQSIELMAAVTDVWPENKIAVRFINLTRDQRKRLLGFSQEALQHLTPLEL